MVSNRYARGMAIRVALLTTALLGGSFALAADGYHSITLLLGLLSLGLAIELYRTVCRTNVELNRFLDAVRYDDFGQQFQARDQGAGFEQLADTFGEIIGKFHDTREQQEARLRHLTALTTHIPVPLLSVFPDGRIRLHNNAARRLFGHANIHRLEDLSVFGEAFADAIRYLEPGRRQLVSFRDDASERQLTVMMTQVITGELSENLISMQDIQSELDSAQLQAWQELVRVLTHEIMNSITPVASLAKTATDLVDDVREQLDQSAPTEIIREELDDVRSAVDIVAKRSDGLTQFVQNYRDMTLLPAPQKEPVSVAELFARLNDLLASQWAAKGISLSTSVEPGDLRLSADIDLLEQMLINLLQNAEQALVGCESPRVILSGRLSQRDHVMLSVEDSGPGVPEEMADKVFVPFFTSKPTGSGVGLALTRQTMIAHGGTVTLGAGELGGAKFSLIF